MSQFAAQPSAAVMPDELLYGIDRAIATITLNAPQRMNTISGPMLKQLTDALVRANEDRDVRVVILTGNGRTFCAGLNLKAQSKGTDNLSVGSGATSNQYRPAQHAAAGAACHGQAGDRRP